MKFVFSLVLASSFVVTSTSAFGLDLLRSNEMRATLSNFDRIGPLLTFDLSLHGLNDHLVLGFDGYVAGKLHQQSAGSIPTPTLDSPFDGTTFATKIDTHFLFRNNDVVSSTALTESVGNPETSTWPTDASGDEAERARTSFGQSLSGSFERFEPTEDWNIAHFAIAQSVATFNFRVEFGSKDDDDDRKQIPAQTVTAALLTSNFDPMFQCGDFDFDGDVDSSDGTILDINWTGALLEPGTKSFSQGDCTGDGDIDTQDEIRMIHNWTGARMAHNGAGVASATSTIATNFDESLQLITGDSMEDVLSQLAELGIGPTDVAEPISITIPPSFGVATSAVVPEPSTALLLLMGILGLGKLRRGSA